MESSTPKKKIPVGLILGIVAAALLAAAVGGYLGLCSWVQDNDCLLPGAVAVDDRGDPVAELGKLPRSEAASVVSRAMDERLDQRSLTITYGDGQSLVLSGELLACSPDTAVERGMSAKAEQPFWKLGLLWLGLAQEPTDLSLSAAAFTPEGEAEARRLIRQIADGLYQAPVDFTYVVGEESVEVTPGFDGRELDADALFEQVLDALANGETHLRAETRPVPGAELTGEILNGLVYVEPKAPGLDENGKLAPAVIGLGVNPEEAQAILDAAVPGQPCTIPLEFTPPGTDGDEALYYKDLLASVTTNLDGVANRSFNVGHAASFCNGKVLQPGEEFSYLGTIGDPSAANGYKTSTGYQDGQTVAMDGGGVCQVSSSLYYCAVYSNLEIVRRACHAFATGYIPNGLDATVYYPSLDFKFRNNTGFPIKIVAYTEGGAYGTLTVQFYGSNPDNIKVEMQRYALSSTPWTTVYQPDESIPVGEQKVEVTPYTGYEVDVYRCVYDGDGNLISRTFENHSKYAKRDKVVLYNPADAASLGLEPPPAATDPVEPVEPPAPPTQDPWTPPSAELPVEPPADPGASGPEPTPEPTPTQYIDLPSPDPTPEPTGGTFNPFSGMWE